jgi:hypothetical protein
MEEKGKEGGKIDDIPAAITISSAIIVCMSVIYSTSYFWLVGAEFQGFMSGMDYLLDSIRLLPIFLLFLIAGLAVVLFFRITIPRFNHTENMKVSDAPLIWLLLLLAVGTYTGFVLYDMLTTRNIIQFYITWLVSLGVIWFTFMVWLFTRARTWALLNLEIYTLLYVFVPVIIFVAYLGLQDARRDLNGVGEKYNLEVKDTSSRLVSVLRNLDKGILYKDEEDQKIHFARWEDVVSFTKDKSDLTKTPTTCKWLNLWC